MNKSLEQRIAALEAGTRARRILVVRGRHTEATIDGTPAEDWDRAHPEIELVILRVVRDGWIPYGVSRSTSSSRSDVSRRRETSSREEVV